MDKDLIELYSESDLAELKRRLRIWAAACIVLGAVTLAVCIAFVVSAYFTESNEMLLPTVITSAVGGFTVLTVKIFAVDEIRAAIKHTSAMLEGEREEVTGSFTVTDERLFIRKGVPIVRVKVEGNGLVNSLQIYDKKVPLLGADAERVTTVYGFITAYGGKHEDI